MKRIFAAACAAALAAAAGSATAHHSFAIYDMTQNIEFKGVVGELKFRNPHIAMTLVRTMPNGDEETINFVEGAPANMLVRMGLKPEMIQPGRTVTAIGAPRKDDPNSYFMKSLILEDGTKFQVLQ
jgi:Family of unknown function (DUF6152)